MLMRRITLGFAFAVLLSACPPEAPVAAPTSGSATPGNTTTGGTVGPGPTTDTECVPVAGKYCCQCNNSMYQEITGSHTMLFCQACDSYCTGNGGARDKSASHGGGCP
jgi:hypothetical protein